MSIDPRAGTLTPPNEVIDLARLTGDFFAGKPDASIAAQRVAFGTSGHRGSAFHTTFNENHIAAITLAICQYRVGQGIDGPLFIGRDTHALSAPAFQVALEVLAANGITTMVDAGNGFTPTPAVSHAILSHNRGRTSGLADGIVITPSHNPPEDGGFKYNPPSGGPAPTPVTSWIENCANQHLADNLRTVKRVAISGSRDSRFTAFDFTDAYISGLDFIIDMAAVRGSGIRIGVDPLGGAATQYWQPIADRFGIALTVTDAGIDATFKNVPRDWDGKIRMDCSSRYPMSRLLARKDDFDIAFANDTDADRHGIVTRDGLMASNDYLAICATYLGRTREKFAGRNIGKTIVSSSMIDRVAKMLGKEIFEVPVGFKWFVDGLMDGNLYFSGEESAGASFLRHDGGVWSTDKDGLIAGLLAAEMTAKTGQTPELMFRELTEKLGKLYYARIDQPADAPLRARLGKIKPDDVTVTELGGDAITEKLTHAPGNKAAIGGIKLVTAKGWVAARPSGTENIYKIYAESFISEAHLARLQSDAREILSAL